MDKNKRESITYQQQDKEINDNYKDLSLVHTYWTHDLILILIKRYYCVQIVTLMPYVKKSIKNINKKYLILLYIVH